MDATLPPLNDAPLPPPPAGSSFVPTDQPVNDVPPEPTVIKAKGGFNVPHLNMSPRTRLIATITTLIILIGGGFAGYQLNKERHFIGSKAFTKERGDGGFGWDGSCYGEAETAGCIIVRYKCPNMTEAEFDSGIGCNLNGETGQRCYDTGVCGVQQIDLSGCPDAIPLPTPRLYNSFQSLYRSPDECVISTPAPTPTTPPNPTGTADACPFTSTQAQVQINASDPWGDSKTINLGDNIRMLGFHNGSGTIPNPVDVDFFVVKPDGTPVTPNPLTPPGRVPGVGPVAIVFTPDQVGAYTFVGKTLNPNGGYYSESVCQDSGSVIVVGSTTPTPTTPPGTTITPNPTVPPTAPQCQQITTLRNGQPVSLSQIQVGDTITFRACYTLLIRGVTFVLTINGVDQAPVNVATAIGNPCADYQVTISQPGSYSVRVVGFTP